MAALPIVKICQNVQMKIKQNLHTSIVRNENNSGIHLSVCRGSTEFMKSYEELWQVQIHCRSDMVW
jgi:hypothetical protein